MFRHYLRTALRFLRRNRLYAGINVLGLSLSLAVSFIILLFVINEFSYDHCHKKRKNIFRVVNFYKEFNQTMAGTPYILASTLKSEFPQVEEAITLRYLRGFRIKQSGEFVNVSSALAASSGVFDIFTIPLEGSTLNEDPLRDLNSIVLSRKLSDQFFPGEDPVGQEIEVMVNNEEQVFIVTGVFKDLPRNTTLKANCLVNVHWTVAPLNKTFKETDVDKNWMRNFWNTWILVSEDADPVSLEKQLDELGKKYISEDPYYLYSFQNLSDVYLRSENVGNSGPAGNLKNIRLFSLVALLIVLIAAINYIILSMAVSSGRAREIGIRKMGGAGVPLIRNQLLGESLVLSLIVLPLALLLMWPAIPYAEKLFQTTLDLIRANRMVYVLIYLLLTLAIGLASGIYASSYLSRLKVLDIIQRKTGFGRKKKLFRSILITLQLVIFCSFVSGTLIIRSQYHFAMEKDTGHYKENILQVDLGRNFKGYVPFLEGVRSHPNVIMAAGAMDGLPMLGYGAYMEKHFQDPEKSVRVEGFSTDFGALETLGVTMVEGRDFSVDFGSDLSQSLIVNETAVEKLGITDPIGREMGGRTIIGVAKDFNLHSIHSEIPPVNIRLTDKYIHHMLVRYRPGSLKELIPDIRAEWEKVEPDRAFNTHTIEDLFLDLYSQERNLNKILGISSLFALVIAAFGLFGLTLFIARSRTNEIGIRKVFGSSERSVVFLFMRTYIIHVLFAGVLSVPVTLYFTTKWLNNFAYRVEIDWWIFIPAVLVAAVVVLTTVFFHALKASHINPVDALRYE